MAILQHLRRPDPASTPIPKPCDDVQFAAAAQLLAAFHDRRGRLMEERERLELERVLSGDRQAYAGNEPALRARLAVLHQATPHLAAPPMPAAPGASLAIQRGLGVLNDQRIAPAPSRANILEQLDRDLGTLAEAISEQRQIVERSGDELTLKFLPQAREASNALNLELYRACQEVCRSVQRLRDFHARIIDAGHSPRSDMIWVPPVRSPLALGSEAEWGSEISGWRRLLQDRGVLPA